MNRGQLAISLLLSVPVGFGVFAAVRITAGRWPMAIAAGALVAVAIFALLVVAVEYEPPLPEE